MIISKFEAAMAYIIGCLMAALSFLLNRALVNWIGIKTVISYSPVIEEASKTLFAYFMGADILATHITFGLVEAGYDWYQNDRHGGKAALFSVVGHSLFGIATVGILAVSSSILLALAAGLLLHLIWNITVIRIYSQL